MNTPHWFFMDGNGVYVWAVVLLLFIVIGYEVISLKRKHHQIQEQLQWLQQMNTTQNTKGRV